jgi:TPR repeat protein
MLLLGFSYFEGVHDVEKDKAMAVMWLQRAVAAGDQPDALVILGHTYLHGHRGVDKDVTLGVKYLEEAADLGLPDAQNLLGMMYREGREGVVQDVELGLKWLEKSAEQGDVDAQAYIGSHYYETEEYEKSLLYWEKSAAQGCTNAQLGLGIYYRDGLGVERNPETSLDFFLEAVEGGSELALQFRETAMQALFQHAVSLTDALIANRPESLRQIQKLADLGHGPAEHMLGK